MKVSDAQPSKDEKDIAMTERIDKSLAALNQPETLKLTPEEWQFFAEDVDLEDQD